MNNFSTQYSLGFFLPTQTLIIIGFECLVWLFFGKAPELLIYDRALIAQGELWRLITAHGVHLDLEHLSLNLCAFLILSTLLESLNAKLILPTLFSGLLSVNLGMWFEMPSLQYYCGLSGVLNSLFVVVLWQLWRVSNGPMVLCFAAGNLLKIAIEINNSDALFSSMPWPPLPEAHLFGVLGGCCLVIVIFLMHQKNTALKSTLSIKKEIQQLIE